MKTPTRSAERQAAARGLLDSATAAGTGRELLVIQRAHSHHLAEVMATEGGPVFRSRTGPPSYGSMDRPNLGRHGSASGQDFTDLLVDPLADDALPVWCDCGPRSLSRTWVAEQVGGSERTVRV